MLGKTPGLRIRHLRTQCDLTQSRLGSIVGLTERTINRIEVGIEPIERFQDSYLILIAKELGTTVESILEGSLPSEETTRGEIKKLWKERLIKSEYELSSLEEVATVTLRQRNNANIPLSRLDLMALLEAIRGSDGY